MIRGQRLPKAVLIDMENRIKSRNERGETMTDIAFSMNISRQFAHRLLKRARERQEA